MADDDTQREIGRLTGAIEEGFRASRERYNDMGTRLDRMERASADGRRVLHERIDKLTQAQLATDECIDKRADGIMSVISAHHKATQETIAELRKDHGERIAGLEETRAEARGGWKYLAAAGAAGSGLTGVLFGAAKWLGMIK